MLVTSLLRSSCIVAAVIFSVGNSYAAITLPPLTPNADTYVLRNSGDTSLNLDGVYATNASNWGVGVWQYDLTGIPKILGARIEYLQIDTQDEPFTADVFLYTGSLPAITDGFTKDDYDSYSLASDYTPVILGKLSGAAELAANNANDWYFGLDATQEDVDLLNARRESANPFALFFMDNTSGTRLFDDKEITAFNYGPPEGMNGIRLYLTVVPEPSGIILAGISVLGLGYFRMKKRNCKN